MRQNKSKPVMEEIRTWLDKQKHIARPKSSFGKAVSYMDNQWERLLVFLDDASVPPHACQQTTPTPSAFSGASPWDARTRCSWPVTIAVSATPST